MSYSISQASGFPPTQTEVTAFYDATNDRTFNIRISVANDTTSTTLVGSTLLTPGQNTSGFAFSSGLSPGTSYSIVMTIRRASNFEQLGTRTVTISTTSPPSTVAVPNVNGLFEATAVSNVQNAGLNPVVEYSDVTSNLPENGQVIGQQPSPGTQVTPGTTVFMTVQRFVATAVNVPNVIGQSQSTAVANIQNAGLVASVTSTSSGATAGNNNTVSSQSPGGGATVSQGSTVSITVFSYTPPSVTVPNVIGLSQASATSTLQNAGFAVGVGSTTNGATSGNNGTVATQSPGAGTSATQGSTVDITVFNFVQPTGTVPNVVGQSLSSATTNIQNAGFVVSSTTTTVGATSGNNGTVASQSPSGGTTANLNTTVNITTFNYIPPQVTVPNVVTQTQASATSTLQTAGFTVSTATTTAGANSSNNGTVATQSPAAGTSAQLGSLVTISIFTFNPPVWTDDVIVNTFVVGTSYSDSVAATNSPSYSITSGTLPAGISINSVTGAITGTPTTAGSYSFVISATNSFGSVSVTYVGTVTAPPVWSDLALADFLQGRAYSDGVVATNSPTYSVTAGALPVGISLNSATGALTGTPTGSGNYNFTISAANTFATITANFTGTIKLQPNWTDNQLGSFINGVDYSDSVTATNAPTYSVSTGSLPAGTTLAPSTGVISGTVTAAVGTPYSFIITATNADGSVSQDFTGSVQPDLGGNLKLFADGAWSDKEVYVYDGTTWGRGTVYIYNGTAWAKSVF